MLERMGAEEGFAVVGLGLEAAPGGVVYSSTKIRELLTEGDVAGAPARSRRCALPGPNQ